MQTQHKKMAFHLDSIPHAYGEGNLCASPRVQMQSEPQQMQPTCTNAEVPERLETCSFWIAEKSCFGIVILAAAVMHVTCVLGADGQQGCHLTVEERDLYAFVFWVVAYMHCFHEPVVQWVFDVSSVF